MTGHEGQRLEPSLTLMASLALQGAGGAGARPDPRLGTPEHVTNYQDIVTETLITNPMQPGRLL
jgi:hypothetical protein